MIDVTAAIWIEAGRVLIARRPPGVSQAGLLGVPGGQGSGREEETPEACLVREIEEELGVRVEVEEFFAESVHAYADKLIRLLALPGAGGRRAPSAPTNTPSCAGWSPGRLVDYAFCPADLPLAARRLQRASVSAGGRRHRFFASVLAAMVLAWAGAALGQPQAPPRPATPLSPEIQRQR
ncbi:MAG: NUDIX domain-containing protein [Desulfomicrobium escambiense]|nr:NUDIX domain-containing protein [Desulfomicrobium escambiense]